MDKQEGKTFREQLDELAQHRNSRRLHKRTVWNVDPIRHTVAKPECPTAGCICHELEREQRALPDQDPYPDFRTYRG